MLIRISGNYLINRLVARVDAFDHDVREDVGEQPVQGAFVSGRVLDHDAPAQCRHHADHDVQGQQRRVVVVVAGQASVGGRRAQQSHVDVKHQGHDVVDGVEHACHEALHLDGSLRVVFGRLLSEAFLAWLSGLTLAASEDVEVHGPHHAVDDDEELDLVDAQSDSAVVRQVVLLVLAQQEHVQEGQASVNRRSYLAAHP